MAIQPPLGSVPSVPGVYRWRDGTGRILYVGKAKRLDKRIASYFRDASELHPRTVRMLSEASTLDWVVCSTEAEALVLERSWIASEQPPFNVALRHGDGYAGVALTRQPIPRLIGWRGKAPAGSKWFGPFPNVRSADLIDALGHVFPVRTCNDTVLARHQTLGRGCLLAETGRCSAPCVSTEAVLDHESTVNLLTGFLSGRNREVVEKLQGEMTTAAEAEQFELAARRRDQLEGLSRVLSQQVAVTGCADMTVVGIAESPVSQPGSGAPLVGIAVVTVTSGEVRGVHARYASLDPTAEDGLVQAVMLAIVDSASPHPLLLLPAELLTRPSARMLSVLPTASGRPAEGVDKATTIPGTDAPIRASKPPRTARNQVEHGVLSFAQRNAENALNQARLRRSESVETVTAALDELAEVLELPSVPRRVECIDISHTQGRHPVASIVVGESGVVKPAEYRRVNIPTDLGGDDPGSIRHALRRRLTGSHCGMAALPDVFLIDGGQMQAAAAAEVVDELFAGSDWKPFVVGLAKRLEELWIPGNPDPVLLPRSSRALQLVQTLRDEAHRWAITGHRRQRDKAALKVRLDEIPGVGPQRRRALLERFDSLDGVSRASLAELSGTPGVGPDLAGRIWSHYHPD